MNFFTSVVIINPGLDPDLVPYSATGWAGTLMKTVVMGTCRPYTYVVIETKPNSYHQYKQTLLWNLCVVIDV